MKIKYEGYIELNDKLLDEYYKEDDYKTYKGYRLLGVDGSEIELQHNDEMRETFGKIHKSKETINASQSIVFYDLLNEIVIDAQLNRYNSSEREHAIVQAKRIKRKGQQKKDIIVADRGFPSLELFSELIYLGYDFVIRYNGENFLKETIPLINSVKNDMVIEIPLRDGNKRKGNLALKKLLEKGYPDKIKLKIVKLKLSKGITEYLITSLHSEKAFTPEDFNEIYNLRWNEEVHFDFQKNVMEVENFSGKTVETVKQDYFSRILVGNLHSLIVSEAQGEIDEETKKNPELKYEKYRVNKSISFGLMKESLFKLLSARNWQKEYNELIKEAKRHKTPVIKNRSYERKKKGNLKYPINKRSVI